MAEPQSLRAEIVTLLNRGLAPLADDEFNALALRVFRFQFRHNAAYRRYCERRIADVAQVERWQDIPAVPTAAFKEATLVSGEAGAAQAVFRTSGTTRAEKRGAHFVLDLDLYERSLLPMFRRYVLNDRAPARVLSLVASAPDNPESSLSYMVSAVVAKLGTADSVFVVDADGLHFELLHTELEKCISAAEPACIVGTSLAFLHWFDHLRATSKRYRLAPASVVMDTGGFKGSNRAITPVDLRRQYAELLGVADDAVVNEYGMTEMLSQFYGKHSDKQGPPWVRSLIVDPDTLDEMPFGDIGLLRHIDLANLFSVSAIQTEDLGRMTPGGFELLGRVAGAAPRGCSIAMDLFLSASR